MDFITWWFDKHYIWSTILTPFFSFIWCLFNDDASKIRAVIAFILWLFEAGHSHKN